ncbi:MAG: hypothetical protein QOK30_1499 [Nocardioidaceae bacterium]|jgi:uncharacterized glyoxalase superfamily protein PhnB|nr:hypothetical protein [Nocardioidaceae bacterium]
MNTTVVRPIRFTDNVEAMQGFLETLGLRPRIMAEAGGWVEMIAGGGMVALHDAASSDHGATSGETRLAFEIADVAGLAERLVDAGVEDVTVYDEAYGKVVTCTDPLGDTLSIDGRSDDLYGYRVVQADTPAASMRVVPVRFTDPRGPYGPWLEALGLRRVAGGDDAYAMYAAAGGENGYVGLHQVYSDDLPIVPGPAAVHLTFATDEPMDDVAARLVAAGFADAVLVHEDFGSMLRVTDVDGRECQVHGAPPGDE